tara:strand:- start:289 stop:462 length:174 start_codon:yes stop_codon:yes gene_type:complete
MKEFEDDSLVLDVCDVCDEEAYVNIDLRCRDCERAEETLPFPGLRLIGNLFKYGRKR